jgi:soluble lytic murein transglycosylase
LESLRRAHAQDALASYQLAVRFRDLGLYRSSILAAASAVRVAGASPATGPRFLGRLIYPIHYADLVVPEARKYNLDPLVMFALLRQESLFESFATSYAAAHGLMQVIPPTGAWIAEQLQWPNYDSQDLYQPYVSVAFGTYYLVVQRDYFDGDLFAAMAAYNAGPGRSATWRQQAGADQNLFVELITIDQPQDYIKRITEHYAVYRTLYGQ